MSRKARARRLLALAAFGSALFGADPSLKPRPITYRDADDIPALYASLGYSTEVKLPKDEQIILVTGANVCDATKGEICAFPAGFFGHLIDIKASGTDAGKSTDLRVFCRSGNDYSFLVQEVSRKSGARADLKVIVTNGDVEAQRATQGPQQLFTVDQVSAMQQQLAEKDAQIQHEHEQSQQRVAKAEQTEANALRCNYEFYDRKGQDFKPSGCEDGHFSFFTVDTPEKPALVEFKDGKDDKPALVQATFANGKYTVPKVLDSGELIVGKSHVKFRRIT